MEPIHKIEALLDRLGHLHRSYHREFAYGEGLNLRQLEALLFLAECNRYSDTPAALTEYLGLTKGTVSQTIISLEGKQLLRKERDKDDGRVIHLQLTSKGKKLVKRCVHSSQRKRILADLEGEKSLSGLEAGLTELLRGMQHLNGHRTFGACHTCAFFRPQGLGRHHQCGLTLEQLYEDESRKVCREHTDTLPAIE